VTIASVLIILSLSANTAFADFPRLCKAVAQSSHLPHSFGFRGRRLVYSNGIFVLAFLAGLLIVLFQGVTDNLIPLFAIGAFLAFTLSQAGMVAHWRRVRGRGAIHSMIVNGLGAVATGITLLVVLVAKFTSGAWVSALLIVALVAFMFRVRRHYDLVAEEIKVSSPLEITHLETPIVIVPIQGWTKVSQRALQFALTLSTDVRAVHVATEEETNDLQERWSELVETPVKQAGGTPPALVNLPSPYRLILYPILDYVLEIEKKNPDHEIAIIVPELIEHHWYHYPLHNQRAELLKALLLRKCSRHVVLINVPWQIKA
jgi:general stress protein CsbA